MAAHAPGYRARPRGGGRSGTRSGPSSGSSAKSALCLTNQTPPENCPWTPRTDRAAAVVPTRIRMAGLELVVGAAPRHPRWHSSDIRAAGRPRHAEQNVADVSCWLGFGWADSSSERNELGELL